MNNVEIEEGTVIIQCTCGSPTCTAFLYVKPNDDIDIIFYGKRQLTVGVPENICLAIRDAAKQNIQADELCEACKKNPVMNGCSICAECGA